MVQDMVRWHSADAALKLVQLLNFSRCVGGPISPCQIHEILKLHPAVLSLLQGCSLTRRPKVRVRRANLKRLC